MTGLWVMGFAFPLMRVLSIGSAVADEDLAVFSGKTESSGYDNGTYNIHNNVKILVWNALIMRA